jgi:hypothetical protein
MRDGDRDGADAVLVGDRCGGRLHLRLIGLMLALDYPSWYASSVAPRDVCPGSLFEQEKGAPLRDSRGRPGGRVEVADSDLAGGSARLVRGRPRKDVIGRLWITSRKTMWISCG